MRHRLAFIAALALLCSAAFASLDPKDARAEYDRMQKWLFSQPIPGDFELAQIGTAVAVFAFLPYCQVTRGNIVVDTFTTSLPARLRGRIDALWDVVYAVAMGFVAVCLTRGTLDTFASHEVSMVLRIPVWPGVAFGALSCGFLAIVSLATAHGLLRGKA